MQHRLFRRLQVSKSPTALLETKTRVEIRIRATGQMEMRASIDIRTCIRFITLIITTSFERLCSDLRDKFIKPLVEQPINPNPARSTTTP